jgi:hypothetical protein
MITDFSLPCQNQIQTLLDLISAARKMGQDWDFAINLSGHCYPIKTPKQIERKLSNYKGRNFLNVDGTTGFFFEPKLERVDLFFVETEQSVVKLPVCSNTQYHITFNHRHITHTHKYIYT